MTIMTINKSKRELFQNATGTKTSPLPPTDYVTVNLRDIKMSLNNPTHSQKRRVTSMEIGGVPVHCTDRFMTSLCAQVGISRNVFSLFDYDEITARVVERNKMDVVRVCLVKDNKKDANMISAMAVSKPGKPIMLADDLLAVLGKVGVENKDIKYADGIITSTHVPTIGGDSNINLGGDEFRNRFVVDTPVDGYGLPAAYVSLLRLRCSNGAVGYSRAFKSEINIGNQSDTDVVSQLSRFIDSFNNDEGYDGIRRRFNAAIDSPASVFELNTLYRMLIKDDMRSVHLNHDLSETELGNGEKVMRSKITSKLFDLGGDPLRKYGLVSLDQIAEKKLRMMDADCTVYDLLNFASELATHHADPNTAHKLQGWIGTLISREYDLEGVNASESKGMVSKDTPDLFLGGDDEGDEE